MTWCCVTSSIGKLDDTLMSIQTSRMCSKSTVLAVEQLPPGKTGGGWFSHDRSRAHAAPLWWSHPDSPQRLDHGPSSNTKRYGWYHILISNNDTYKYLSKCICWSIIGNSFRIVEVAVSGQVNLFTKTINGLFWQPISATSLLPKRPTKLKAVPEFHKTLRKKWATVKYDSQQLPFSKIIQ